MIVRRSARRKKTIQARMEGDSLLVMAPADISDELLEEHITKIKAKVKAKIEKRNGPRSDAHLEMRARHLNGKYFGNTLSWENISYSERQMKLYGSCTPNDKTIRISYRVREMPQWVEDYVILHELAHLLEQNHGRRFKELVQRYPLTERATGFLMAMRIMEKRGQDQF